VLKFSFFFPSFFFFIISASHNSGFIQASGASSRAVARNSDRKFGPAAVRAVE